ncbi:ras-like protein family member 12 [Brevipalpus obovatus]|uniref:ras-like protein family member 12 n=1 Tax=Brevipalpus obovatus TaxID=246614 RepID=UPI003D9DC7A2
MIHVYNYSCRELEENILWANGFVVLYDISDRDSLIEAQVYLETINSIRSIAQTPIILIANKRDLEAGREVPISDGRNLAVQFGGQFFEVSAADTYIGVCVLPVLPKPLSMENDMQTQISNISSKSKRRNIRGKPPKKSRLDPEKKERRRGQGKDVREDTIYTGRKRSDRF